MPRTKKLKYTRRKARRQTTQGDEPPQKVWSYIGVYDKISESKEDDPYHVIVMKLPKKELAKFPAGPFERHEKRPQIDHGLQLGDEIEAEDQEETQSPSPESSLITYRNEEDDHDETQSPPSADFGPIKAVLYPGKLSPEVFQDFLRENPESYRAWLEFVDSQRHKNEQPLQTRRVGASVVRPIESRENPSRKEYGSLYSQQYRSNHKVDFRDPSIAAIGDALREIRSTQNADAMDVDGEETISDNSTTHHQDFEFINHKEVVLPTTEGVEMSGLARVNVRQHAANILEIYNELKEQRQGTAKARNRYDEIFKGIDETLEGWYKGPRWTYQGRLWAAAENIRELDLRKYHEAAKSDWKEEAAKEEKTLQELVDEAREMYKWVMEGKGDVQQGEEASRRYFA